MEPPASNLATERRDSLRLVGPEDRAGATPARQSEPGPELSPDLSLWTDVFREAAPALLAFLRRRVGQPSEAEDLLQETFVRAMRAGRAQHGDTLRAYLFATARNLLLNRHRHLRVVRRVEVDSLDSPETEGRPSWGERVADPGASPEQQASWRRFRRDLDDVLSTLSADLRLAFRLGVVERWTYLEIADKTGWSLPQVKTNVHRARQRLIANLGDRLPLRPAASTQGSPTAPRRF